ncbi:hypothetical protein OEA41_004291 [Lepraria neglecta]|uniref:Methyltransferase domain-containing protein n=1 Tax=Lepraria neglecta TaxID=209136 RepID=A0AAE0DG11_9LECA|nr:hypothetical protein OEA41_004291 [Lepraria neglecta]
MATEEAYMLSRNHEESRRLDAQHHFSRELAHGHLIQPSIPQSGLRSIADVGTGTGIWLREAAQELATPNEQIEFTGFDISVQQFPKDSIQGVNFVMHDIVEPFPQEYHEKFDLVHVRLLSYAIKEQDLDKAVENIIQILRPGGYLQWQEFDPIDSWAVPDTPNARIAAPLIRAIQSFQTPISTGNVNPISWTGDLVRIMHLETISTLNHPSRAVEAGKKQEIMGAAVQLLQAGMSRRQSLAAQVQVSGLEAKKLREEVEEMIGLIEAWRQGGDPACNDWDCTMTSIIARKALMIDAHEAWMTAKY